MLTARSVSLTVLIGALIGGTVLALSPEYAGVRAGKADADYIASRSCTVCHADHYQSWARTYHSRMTQEARPGSVRGDFEENNSFTYLGITARMETRNGRYFATLTHSDRRTETFSLDRTVGSRRIEQYLTKEQGQYVRLPFAYDLVNHRWMNLNGSFFYPDGVDYFQHRTQWDTNCVFCHNVKAQPNIDWSSRQFETEVAELGIACGACHGAAAQHAEMASSPFTRTLWRLDESRARNIVHPRKLDSDRSMMICGHCHGQRVPEPFDRIREILSHGDPFNAGDDLSGFYTPVRRETKVGDFSFANRFWSNGSPRLTAYEYQGVLRSQCYTEGTPGSRINCLTCHSMHEGDPAGQIKAENRTNQPCLECHQQYSFPSELQAHSGHQADSAGSLCYNCHMPRVVYGVMSVHPTHEITVPDATLSVTGGVPNACNQCHLDKSVNWSIASSKALWPDRFGSARFASDELFNLAEGPRALFAGDALTRALAAEAMGGGGPVSPDPKWAAPFLIEALSDNYPIVRFFSANALAAGGWRLRKPDYLGDPANRLALQLQWRSLFDPATRSSAANLANLLRRARIDLDIEVGE